MLCNFYLSIERGKGGRKKETERERKKKKERKKDGKKEGKKKERVFSTAHSRVRGQPSSQKGTKKCDQSFEGSGNSTKEERSKGTQDLERHHPMTHAKIEMFSPCCGMTAMATSGC